MSVLWWKAAKRALLQNENFPLLNLHSLTLPKITKMKMIAMHHLEKFDLKDKIVLKEGGIVGFIV